MVVVVVVLLPRLLAVASLILALIQAIPDSTADFSQQVITLINAAREANGLPSLSVSPELMASAQGYAQAMAAGGFVDHSGRDGSNLASRDEAAGYRDWAFLAENLAGGQATAAAVVAAWLASPEHRANILSPNASDVGIGYGYAPGSTYWYYWVAEFGARSAAPVPPATPSWLAPTGHTVSGVWLSYLHRHGDVDNLGLPESDVTTDPSTGQTIQYFQRVVLELHPENPESSRIQRRLLGDILYPGADPPTPPDDVPPGPTEYFPFSPDQPTGLGHFVANYTRDGEPIYFKDYFDAHGGVDAFGYPKEEPKLRAGIWSQRFQAAVFEYHPENDRDGFVAGTSIPLRNYRVQLELLTDQYLHHQ